MYTQLSLYADTLSKSLSYLKVAIEKKPALPIYSNVRFDVINEATVKLSAADLSSGLYAVTQMGAISAVGASFTLKFADLEALVKRVKSGVITLQYNHTSDTAWVLDNDTLETDLSFAPLCGIAASEFIAIPDFSAIENIQTYGRADFLSAVTSGGYAYDREKWGRENLKCARVRLFDTVPEILTLDDYRIAAVNYRHIEQSYYLVYASTLERIAKAIKSNKKSAESVSVGTIYNHLVITDSHACTYIVQLYDGRLPNIEYWYTKTVKGELYSVDRAGIEQALKDIKSCVDNSTNGVNIRADESGSYLRPRKSEYPVMRFTSNLPVGTDLLFNYKYLTEMIKNAFAGEIILQSGGKDTPMIVHGDSNYFALVMPQMRN